MYSVRTGTSVAAVWRPLATSAGTCSRYDAIDITLRDLRQLTTYVMECTSPAAVKVWYMYIHSKTSLNRPTLGRTLNGSFRKVIGLGTLNMVVIVLYGRSFGTQIK